ncbi:hypothetical protein [Paenibacillus mendelii]|uniref:Uncharacterized protein n=1 Tax=Paenibacillus mendelii TaxID=206163 RepID=A0ABV6JI85_9BACL|nr:hypothetical protein [Paenibacillus mendelii]MCQ6563699.1 hypothetical protein [Paenibacillus mendelii]
MGEMKACKTALFFLPTIRYTSLKNGASDLLLIVWKKSGGQAEG